MASVFKLRSARLDNERPIWIREPAARTGSNPLVVFLDAELYRERVQADGVIDALNAGSRVADAWYVFVSHESPESRWRECPCHLPFAEFIAEELLPWLERHDPALGRAQPKILVGLSYTGLAAAFVVKEFPGLFAKVISQSGSFWYENGLIIESYRQSARIPTEFYLDVGRREIQENVRHREDVLQVISQIDGVGRFRDVLVEKGHPVKYVEFDGGHSSEGWRQTLPDALAWAIPP